MTLADMERLLTEAATAAERGDVGKAAALVSVTREMRLLREHASAPRQKGAA